MVSVTLDHPLEATQMANTTINPELLKQVSVDLIREAFRDRQAGINTRFEELRRTFATKPTAVDATSTMQLNYLLVALTSQIDLLDSTSIILVKTLLSLNWTGRDLYFVQNYIKFLGALVSSHAEFSRLVVQGLVRQLNIHHDNIGRLPNHLEVDKDTIYSRIHTALAHVLELVPFLKESLLTLIIAEFPHKSENVAAQSTYIENLLKMSSYVPSIEGPVIGVIIEKLIAIDVEIQIDLNDLELEDDDIVDLEMSHASPDNDSDLSFFDEEDEMIEDEAPNLSLSQIKSNIKKLDHMITIIFTYLHPIFTNLPLEFNTQQALSRYSHAEGIFAHLLYSLNDVILKTYQSKYSQFILFWAAQQTQIFTDDFLGVVVGRALDPNSPAAHRMIAASYIGSFTARAKTLCGDMIRKLVDCLVNFTNYVLDTSGVVSIKGDAIKRFGVLYAMVQALIYVFCFRWRDLQDEGEDGRISWLRGLQTTLERAIYHRQLNPLRYCSANIVHQFAKVSHHLDFVFCGTIIEANKRMTRGSAQVDSYFPFDPYALSKSRHFVDSVYQAWKPIAGLEEDETSDSDSDA